MSILKVILHHWNKTSSAYDTFHPETEVAQVADWNQGIVNTLASTALGTLVNTLTSDSLLATMIQKVLTATGVKYSMGQNGYICFGGLFGGLIIQWGLATEEVITLPIAFSKTKFVVLGTCVASQWIYENVSILNDSDLTTVTAWSASENQAGRVIKSKNIIAIGR
jgi:hypothetical protein